MSFTGHLQQNWPIAVSFNNTDVPLEDIDSRNIHQKINFIEVN